MKRILLFITILAACQSNKMNNFAHNESGELKDGIYLILNEFDSDTSKKSNGSIIVFDKAFLDGNLEGQPEYLEIDTSEFVELNLATEPDGIEQPDERINLMLTLDDEASDHMKAFTTKNLNKRVAIVIGNMAVTKHKVRTVIDEGKLQITRCTDNACKYLYFELKDNVKQ